MNRTTFMTRPLRRIPLVLLSLAVLIMLTACGGSSSSGTGTVSAVRAPQEYTVVVGGSVQLIFAVRASDIQGWSVNTIAGGDTVNGTVSGSGTFYAPLAVPASNPVTVVGTHSSGVVTAKVRILTLAQALGKASYDKVFDNISGMKSPRSNHTATVLTDGTVLVAGGVGGDGAASAAAETYDPQDATSNAFRLVSPMGTARAYHSATILTTGKVLLAGGVGSDGLPVNSAELYDPLTRRFVSTGAMNTARWLHSATLLDDGTVAIIGGNASTELFRDSGQAIETVEIYDPRTGKFSQLFSRMQVGRYDHTATKRKDGAILVAGGSSNSAAHQTIELYKPLYARFSSALMSSFVRSQRSRHTATLIPQTGLIYFIGGSNGAINVPPDPLLDESGTRTLQDALTSYLLYASASQQGYDVYDQPNGSMSSLQYVRLMGAARAGHAATLLADGKVLITGGYGFVDPKNLWANYSTGGPQRPQNAVLASAELFNPQVSPAELHDQSPFIPVADMAVQRIGHTATMLPSSAKVLVLGGRNGSGASLNTAELYR